MESDVELEKRVIILETGMTWAQSNIQDTKRDLEILKEGQLHLLEKIGDLGPVMQSEIGALHSEMHQEIGTLRSELHQEIGGIRSDMKSEFAGVQSEFAGVRREFAGVQREFAGVQREFAGVHKEIAGIHKAISVQTKWMLAIILGAATLASIIQPLMTKLL